MYMFLSSYLSPQRYEIPGSAWWAVMARDTFVPFVFLSRLCSFMRSFKTDFINEYRA